MKIVKQIEEQISSYFDPTYSEQLDEIQKELEEAWEYYDKAHLEYNVPPGSELYHAGKMIDFAIVNFQFDLMWLEEQLIDLPENPFELAEEMIQQEGIF